MFKVLKNSSLFNGFNEEDIENILKKIKYTKREFFKGENVAFRGDKIENLLIITKGTVVTEMLAKDGSIRKIENLGQADILASAFIFGANNIFPVDIIAIQDVEVLYIQKREFLKLLMIENKILENFLNEISNKTQLLSSKIWASVNDKTIAEKFNSYIQKNIKNEEIIIGNLKELSESFGVARPSLSRVINKYIEEKKLQRIKKNKYKILDKNFFEI